MVFLSLSIVDIDESIDFYCKKLRIFDSMAGSRLICNTGVDLIIDLYEVGSDSHRDIFGVNEHVRSSFSIHHGDHIKVKIIDALKRNDIQYTTTGNVAGVFLKIVDPSGNRFSVWGYHGYVL